MTAAALLLLAALAAPPASTATVRPSDTLKGQCIEQIQDPSWAPVDDHTILVTSGLRRFKVVTNTCPALTRQLPIISTVLLGGSSICGPHDAHLYVSSPGDVAPVPCFMQSITPLTDAEAKALGKRTR